MLVQIQHPPRKTHLRTTLAWGFGPFLGEPPVDFLREIAPNIEAGWAPKAWAWTSIAGTAFGEEASSVGPDPVRRGRRLSASSQDAAPVGLVFAQMEAFRARFGRQLRPSLRGRS